ncbi:MAG TPA: hypothetical protein VMF67_00090 [Rhizomicrobium sp.]|nr:hypothetical protein [Rhizomicrobium sp.]
MAVATERVVVLMTRTEKRALEAKARRMGSSAAELVRRSVDAFDEALEVAEVEALLKTLATTHAATLTALDRAERELAETRAWFAAKKPQGKPR